MILSARMGLTDEIASSSDFLFGEALRHLRRHFHAQGRTDARQSASLCCLPITRGGHIRASASRNSRLRKRGNRRQSPQLAFPSFLLDFGSHSPWHRASSRPCFGWVLWVKVFGGEFAAFHRTYAFPAIAALEVVPTAASCSLSSSVFLLRCDQSHHRVASGDPQSAPQSALIRVSFKPLACSVAKSSSQFDFRCLDEFAPFFCFVDDKLPEIGGGPRKYRGA
jgi:hypothetical protein